MNIQRQQMNKALKQIVVPYLRAHNFKGSFPHFRRKQLTHIDLITFQFNRYGGSFVVELTTCPLTGVVDCFGVPIPFQKLTALDRSERYRLIANDHSEWFDYELYEMEEQFETLAYFVKERLPLEEPQGIQQCLDKSK